MDVTGHLGILHLFNYFQEAAGNHARALGVGIEDLHQKQLTWMLSRFHIQVNTYPAWKDTLVIETWPSGHNGLQAIREFLLYTEDGTQIGKGTSAWLMIDLNRYRPIRIPDFIDAIELPDLPRPIDDPFNRLTAPDKELEGKVFTVGFHDLDINKHANSVHYIRWALEAVPDDIRSTSQLQGLEIQFRAEAKHGDEIVSRLSRDEQTSTFRHGLCLQATTKELAIIHSTWE